MHRSLQLLSEHEAAPHKLFNSPAEQESWNETYIKAVSPTLEEWRKRRAQSWHESFSRGPYVSNH